VEQSLGTRNLFILPLEDVTRSTRLMLGFQVALLLRPKCQDLCPETPEPIRRKGKTVSFIQ
jgi:hypothetical protein